MILLLCYKILNGFCLTKLLFSIEFQKRVAQRQGLQILEFFNSQYKCHLRVNYTAKNSNTKNE